LITATHGSHNRILAPLADARATTTLAFYASCSWLPDPLLPEVQEAAVNLHQPRHQPHAPHGAYRWSG